MSIAKSWLRGPRKGRIPKVKTLGMLLTRNQGYRIRGGFVEIVGGCRLKIVGWD